MMEPDPGSSQVLFQPSAGTGLPVPAVLPDLGAGGFVERPREEPRALIGAATAELSLHVSGLTPLLVQIPR